MSNLASVRNSSPASPESRPPSGAVSPRRYRPVSRPRIRGKYGIRPRPKCSQAGATSASAPRLSRLYSFWALTKRLEWWMYEVQSASAICQPLKFEQPM